MIYEKCREILLRECELVQHAASIQEKIRNAVMEREWADFEEYINTMNHIENSLAGMEDEREQLFSAFESLVRKNNPGSNVDGDAKSRFYSLASLLPEEQRNDLTSIFRSLKIEAIRLRIANETFKHYVAGLRTTLKEIFDIAFPERGGMMYTQRGTHLSNDMRSMVLNQSF
jgi:hypothetical protein